MRWRDKNENSKKINKMGKYFNSPFEPFNIDINYKLILEALIIFFVLICKI